MATYTQRVRDSILPLSVADTLPKAFEEWRFTGDTHDHEEPCENSSSTISTKLNPRTLKRGSSSLLISFAALRPDGAAIGWKSAVFRQGWWKGDLIPLFAVALMSQGWRYAGSIQTRRGGTLRRPNFFA